MLPGFRAAQGAGEMIRIVHVISDLDTGGAEAMLVKLVRGMDRSRFMNTVISLTDKGQLGAAIESAGGAVYALGMKRGRPDLLAVSRLIRLLRMLKPTIVQSWLYHADLLSLLATKLIGFSPLIWNVRCVNMALEHYSRQTKWVRWILARLSGLPAAVVVNSHAGQRWHREFGYSPRRWEVIPNGFDTGTFAPDSGARRQLREELRLPTEAVVVSLFARVDPAKDHQTFFSAARQVLDRHSMAYFVLVGRGTEQLVGEVRRWNLDGHVSLVGHRNDVERLMPGVDIACLSSSFGEGFPNVLGEAMACGVPCVSTDVGDVRNIIGDTGLVVPVRDPGSLAHAVIDLIDRGPAAREGLGRAARARIEQEYSLRRIINRYAELYTGLSATDPLNC